MAASPTQSESPGAPRVPPGPPRVPRAPRLRSDAPRGWMALCLALFLTTCGLAALAATLGSAARRQDAPDREVRSVSERFVTALLSYDYRDLAPAKANVLALSTPRLAAELERDFQKLADALRATETLAAAKVTKVYIGPRTSSAATTIVVANAASQSKAGVRAAVASYFQVDLARVERRWLVDRVTPIREGDPTPLQPQRAGPPTSAAPANP